MVASSVVCRAMVRKVAFAAVSFRVRAGRSVITRLVAGMKSDPIAVSYQTLVSTNTKV
jgi:hypothetical protein